jgi:hypothetical protein
VVEGCTSPPPMTLSPPPSELKAISWRQRTIAILTLINNCCLAFKFVCQKAQRVNQPRIAATSAHVAIHSRCVSQLLGVPFWHPSNIGLQVTPRPHLRTDDAVQRQTRDYRHHREPRRRRSLTLAGGGSPKTSGRMTDVPKSSKLLLKEEPMQNAPTSLKMYPGATRDLLCSRCSTRNNRPVLRRHLFGVSRVWPDDQFWQCTACAHRIPAFQPADLVETADPEAEILRAQWREDNEDYPRWTQDHRE